MREVVVVGFPRFGHRPASIYPAVKADPRMARALHVMRSDGGPLVGHGDDDNRLLYFLVGIMVTLTIAVAIAYSVAFSS